VKLTVGGTQVEPVVSTHGGISAEVKISPFTASTGSARNNENVLYLVKNNVKQTICVNQELEKKKVKIIRKGLRHETLVIAAQSQ